MDLHIPDKKQVVRGVCFNKARYQLFEKINDSKDKGITMKKIMKEDDDTILITEYSQINTVDLDTKKSPKEELDFTNIADAIAEKGLYERVNIQGILTNLSEVNTVSTSGSDIRLKTALVHDTSGYANLTIFGCSVDNVEENKTYKISHVCISNFKSSRVLKTTELTKFTQVTLDYVINVTKSVDHGKVTGKFISLILSTLEEKMLCPECKHEVDVEDSFVVCANCTTMSPVEMCSKEGKVNATFIETSSQKKYQVQCDMSFMQQHVQIPVSEKISFVKQLLSMGFTAEIDFENLLILSLVSL